MASLICEGVGETRRGNKPKFFCVAKGGKTEKDSKIVIDTGR